MILKLVLLAIAGVAAASAPGAGAPPADCSKAAVASAGDAVRAARAELASIPPEADDRSVTPAASRLIEALKDRLRDFVRAEMACAPRAPDPADLAAAMAASGDSFAPSGSDESHPVPPGRHGDRLAYEVFQVDSHPDMLAVVATLGIRCGSDSILLLYRRTPSGWREAMVRRAEPYREVKGGWQDLRFAVSPADAQGKWFVATVSTTPWCTSAWQGMPYALARPGPSTDRPRIFFRGKGGIYLGNASDLKLRAERDSVEIRHDGVSLDPDILIRRHVRRYSVAGERVRRVQPVAENVRDFVDEWVDSPWAEAKDWSGRDPALAGAHAGLKAARWETLGGFATIRACGGVTQVEIAGRDGPGWFLIVRGGANGPWTMERVARRPAAGCTGAEGTPHP
ncbi:MAG: hypothetical protein ACXWU3_14380 [Allosphingosinicella sp.]